MRRLLAAVVFLGIAGLSVQAHQCPGSQQKCATGMTCCELPSGQQGCCPYANATCCPDRVHCCPLGSTCSTKGGGHCHATPKFATVQSMVQHSKTNHSADPEALPEVASSPSMITTVGDVCGDGSSCPGQSTCCPLGDGHFACCPMASAVCCSDNKHCCQQGTKCGEGGCIRDYAMLPFLQIRGPSVKKFAVDVKDACPGGSGTECPGDATCCATSEGSWGCCPMPNAVCCPDHETCCPSGYKCSSSQGQPGCIKQG